jgi:hypothetical protein
MADEQTCANCGMDMAIASHPVEKDDKTYCCEGCARDTGCTC